MIRIGVWLRYPPPTGRAPCLTSRRQTLSPSHPQLWNYLNAIRHMCDIFSPRSCTCWLRIMFRDFSQSVSVVCISRSAALKMGFQPLIPPSWHDRGHTCAAQCHDHAPAPLLTHSAAAATAAHGTGAPRGASTHDWSVPLPWPGCRAATVWPSPSRWWAPAAAEVGISWREVSRN